MKNNIDTYIELLLSYYCETLNIETKLIAKAYNALSDRYRQSAHTFHSSGYKSPEEVVAYSVARAPATYAVVSKILSQLHVTDGALSLLDLGAGPGTAAFAAMTLLPISTITLVEQEKALILAAEKAFSQLAPAVSVKAQPGDLELCDFPEADLVLLSYVLTEMPIAKAIALYQKALNASRCLNVMILPGTPDAFQLLLKLRDCVISDGNFTILAPCAHATACPFAIAGPIEQQQAQQWCHFRERLARSNQHQQIKHAGLGYEDEPYTYLVVKRKDSNSFSQESLQHGTVIQTPRKRPGHVYLDFCTTKGSHEAVCFSKREKQSYQKAKGMTWGDQW